ncbi:hypothetical protein B0H11DRAFT_2027456 [Mycena galericulata]|nr:hypothetical protein B0H11DRAFT_2027456 [Mycena galericulata]
MPGQILFLLISPLSFFSRRTTHVLPLRKYLVRLRANSRQGFVCNGEKRCHCRNAATHRREESNLHTPLYVYRALKSSCEGDLPAVDDGFLRVDAVVPDVGYLPSVARSREK